MFLYNYVQVSTDDIIKNNLFKNPISDFNPYAFMELKLNFIIKNLLNFNACTEWVTKNPFNFNIYTEWVIKSPFNLNACIK